MPPLSRDVPTIAWRLHHIGGSVLGWRVAAHVTHTANSHAEHIARVRDMERRNKLATQEFLSRWNEAEKEARIDRKKGTGTN